MAALLVSMSFMVNAAIVAQLVPAKRHVDFIHAMAEVAKQYPQARFLIVGADPHPRGEYGQSLQNLVDCLGLGEQIHFIGFCADMAAIMAAIMAGLDVVVLTSASEAFGRVLVEAMYCGLPVVAAAVGGVPQVVEQDKNGLMVPPQRPDLLAAALLKLAEDEALRRELGVAAAVSAQEYSMERMIDKITVLYEELLRQKGVGDR